ncbi:hypothetical protein [Tetragenococcus halophilus]|uniref:hypothetical protein n=1 Tax=Tetragenococcus halophilus TaxID=51669 RepID=UPI0030F00FEA
MDNVITGTRRSGKTTNAILMSHNEGKRIITYNYPSVQSIMDKTKDMGLEIKEPVTIHEIEKDGIESLEEYIVDEAQLVLQNLLAKRNIEVTDMFVTKNIDLG